MKRVLCFLLALATLSAAATNNVEYILIPVVRIPTTNVDRAEVSELRVEGLSLAEQSARLARLIKQWGAVYESVSGETIHPRSYFGRKQTAILKKVAKDGATDEILQMLTEYQTQLNQYLKRQTLKSRKESKR